MNRFALICFALIAATACDDLPSGDIKSPYYWADVFLNKFEDERRVPDVLEPGPGALEEPRTVLLITGVTIKAEWFDLIVARLERDGFRPVIWEPPELLSGSLFEATEMLADVVQQVRDESGQDTIDILAECTGGVVARHYVQSLGGDQYVDRLVTFVSPHAGIDKSPLAAKLVNWPALYDLSPGSEFLEAVNSVPLPDNVLFTSIYTCGDEYIRPYQTSIVEGGTNIGLCDEFVGHFQTFYDPEIYLIMHGQLTEPLPEQDAAPDKTDDMDPELDDEELAAGGCSAAPSAGGWAGTWLLAAAMLLVVRRRRRAARA